ncbi:MAG: cytochrome C oxidase subunit IV family protein [Planctomycetaceae bacterium]|nr:cytochrome C oxidase subunit IV family protein [Planctomycetaceae bacterium]MBV8675635.1 cytochrome C oxidase subunit IV family protein [Planctomycetaceae bacterium]
MAESHPPHPTHPIPAPEQADESQTLYVRTDRTLDQELHIESHAPYLKVWAGLAFFTAIEYFYAHIFKDMLFTLILGLLFWAVIKASMVGWYFMHLKFEGRWVYFMLIPAGILAMILTLALVPDLAMQPITEENPEEETVFSAPLEPGAASPALPT